MVFSRLSPGHSLLQLLHLANVTRGNLSFSSVTHLASVREEYFPVFSAVPEQCYHGRISLNSLYPGLCLTNFDKRVGTSLKSVPPNLASAPKGMV